MGVRYSYDDFTTKGHGVIEGYFGNGRTRYTGKKSTKRRVKKSPEPTHTASNHKKNVDEAYNHLMQIKRASQYSRNNPSDK